MPRNGSGSYSLPELPFTAGTTISSAAVNDDFSDIATALTGSVASDGQTTITGSLKGFSGSVSSPSYSFSAETTSGFYFYSSGKIGIALAGVLSWIISATGISTSGGMSLAQPVGFVGDYAGSTAPAGWLLCYGQAISRTTYSQLFTAIGTTFGTGDGSTTFNIPDCRGRAGVGKDDMGGTPAGRITAGGSGITGTTLGAAGGEQTHTLTTTELAAHNHGVTDPGHVHTYNTYNVGGVISGGTSFFPATSTSPNTASSQTGITINNAGGGGAHNNTQPTIIFNKIIFAGV